MTLDNLLSIYFIGALLTACSVTKLKRFYQCVLLWPIFWAFLTVMILEMAVEEFRHGR